MHAFHYLGHYDVAEKGKHHVYTLLIRVITQLDDLRMYHNFMLTPTIILSLDSFDEQAMLRCANDFEISHEHSGSIFALTVLLARHLTDKTPNFDIAIQLLKEPI